MTAINNERVHLRLISINDVYTLENFPKLGTLIDDKKAGANNCVCLLPGDFLSPSLLSSLDKGKGTVDCLNHLGFDIVSFGNHEDDVGRGDLLARIHEFKGIWLNSNVPGYENLLPKYHIIEVTLPFGRTVRVGFLAVVMHDPATYRRVPFAGLAVENANETALKMGQWLLNEQNCCCVIAMTHQFINDDRQLAAGQPGRMFAVIVGGHEHVPFLENTGITWITKSGSDSTHAAIIDLVWPEQLDSTKNSGLDWPSVTIVHEPVSTYTERQDLRELVDSHMASVRELTQATLLKLDGEKTLTSVGTRAKQTSLGTLVCNLIRDALGADCCLVNGGGIRANRTYHERFTYGDLEAEIPFDNEMVVVEMPASVLRETIRLSRLLAPVQSGGFLQCDDSLGFDPSEKNLTSIVGQPYDDSRPVRVALVREMLTGMDHNQALVQFGKEHPDKIPRLGSGRGLRNVLVDAFAHAIWHTLGDFELIDTNGDGVISRPELAAALERIHAEPPSQTVVDLVFNTLDRDQDESISRSEAPPLPERKSYHG